MDDSAKCVMIGRLLVSILCKRRETDFSYQALCFRAQMSYEVQDRQIVEGVKVEEIFRI